MANLTPRRGTLLATASTIHAAQVIFLKRSMRPGFAGIENELLYDAKTKLLFGDAKATLTKVLAAVKAM